MVQSGPKWPIDVQSYTLCPILIQNAQLEPKRFISHESKKDKNLCGPKSFKMSENVSAWPEITKPRISPKKAD